MEDEKILIDRKTLKAIASDTRMDILKYLGLRKYTLSELSLKTKLKNSTIKEHLEHLINSGLVKKEESESKWKYYSLTDKGKKLVKPKQVKLFISFMISFFTTLGLIGLYIFKFIINKTEYFGRNNVNSSAEVSILNTSLDIVSQESADVLDTTSSIAIDSSLTIFQSLSNKEIILIIAIFFLLILSIFLLILIFKEKRKYKNKCIQLID